jgi:hypothetical protein
MKYTLCTIKIKGKECLRLVELVRKLIKEKKSDEPEHYRPRKNDNTNKIKDTYREPSNNKE